MDRHENPAELFAAMACGWFWPFALILLPAVEYVKFLQRLKDRCERRQLRSQ